MIKAELVGGPDCGVILELTGPEAPPDLMRALSQRFAPPGSPKGVAGEERIVHFKYQRNTFAPRRRGTIAYEFVGYPRDGGSTLA